MFWKVGSNRTSSKQLRCNTIADKTGNVFPVLRSAVLIALLVPVVSAWASPRKLPRFFYGVTIDSVQRLQPTVTALRKLDQRPVTRIVFDEFVPAADYAKAVRKIHAVSFIMGEILDSQFVSQYSVAEYERRTEEYVTTLRNRVDLWEIGNEVNGEWLGATADVVGKIEAAQAVVKQAGGRTALTLYYNQDCYEDPQHEMFTWADANISGRLRLEIDYVLISYYEDDCNGLKPKWRPVFKRLASMFPNAKLGFGEMGTTRAQAKAEMINRYYSMPRLGQRYVGGYFWWYFRQDMVPSSKPLWSVLNGAIREK